MGKVISMEQIPDKYMEDEEEAHKVRYASDFFQKVVDRIHNPEDDNSTRLPWRSGDEFRLRPSEVTVFAGINGHGKSQLLSHIILSAMQQGDKAMIASMEMQPEATLERMSKQATAMATPSVEYLAEVHDWYDEKLWIYDHMGQTSPRKVLAVIRYSVEELKVNHIVIDSLMKCGINPDDYNAQKRFVDRLCTYAKNHKCHIYLVHHARKSDSEKKLPDKFDIKGAGETVDLVDNAVICWRNKEKQEKLQNPLIEQDEREKLEKKPDCVMSVVKQRHGDGGEPKINLWFDAGSRQYIPRKNGRPVRYVDYSKEKQSGAVGDYSEAPALSC